MRAIFCILAISFFAVGCIKQPPPPKPEVIVVSRPAPVPEGAVRYCWEEPMVVDEKNGPGINDEGTWYHPAHTAVRSVRSGKWRPCRKVKSEKVGGLRR